MFIIVRFWYALAMRVALYGRVSKDNGKQDTENQLGELRELLQRSNWAIVHEYVDKASGKTADRPELGSSSRMPRSASSIWCSSGRWIASAGKERWRHSSAFRSCRATEWIGAPIRNPIWIAADPSKMSLLVSWRRWRNRRGCGYPKEPRRGYSVQDVRKDPWTASGGGEP